MKQKTLLLTFFFACLVPEIKAQNTIDTAAVKIVMAEGFDLLNNSMHLESIEKYKEAKTLALKIDLKRQVVKSEVRIIENLWRLSDLEDAARKLEELLPNAKEWLGEEDFEVGEIYHQKGVLMMLDGDYDSAIYYYDKSVSVRAKYEKEGWPALSAAYVNKAYIYGEQGDIGNALIATRSAYEIDKKVYGERHLYIAEDLNNISAYLTNRSQYQSAIEALLGSLSILEDLDNQGEIYSMTLSNLGRNYTEIKEFSKASEFAILGLQNNIRLFGRDHINHVDIYENLGKAFLYNENYDSSIYYYNRGLEFQTELVRRESAAIIFLLRGIALAYAGKEEFERAFSYSKKAIEYVRKSKHSNHFLAILYNDLGRMKGWASDFEASESYLLKAIDFFAKEEGDQGFMSFTYLNLSDIYLENKRYSESLQSAQKALESNHVSWRTQTEFDQPPFDGWYNYDNLLYALNAKSKNLELMYFQENGSEDLFLHLLETFELLDRVIRSEIRKTSRIDDKVQLLEFSHKVYERAIAANLAASEKFGEETYLLKCFQYSEADKSVILSESLNSHSASLWSGIPDSLLLLEMDIKADLSYTTTLFNSSVMGDSTSVETGRYRKRLFELNSDLDSLFALMERNYPKYYRLKYTYKLPDYEDVQKEMERDEVLIEYFVGDSLSYAFVVFRDQSLVKRLGSSDEIKTGVQNVRDIMQSVSLNKPTKPHEFIYSSRNLYKLLIEPFEEHLVKVNKLIIVPSSTLHYIPFDILIEADSDSASLISQSYLMKQFNIQNTYSASLEFFKSEKPHTRKNDVIGFAPSYADVDEESEPLVPAIFRSALVPLKWNKNEIESIDRLIGSTNMTDKSASEAAFKKNTEGYRVIHLAMHAFVDDEDPMKSKLLFTPNVDSIEDGFLHTYELYNMSIGADLVVLSACETGYGKLVEGNGIMSLARGFATAGVPSVVMSHWQVDDESTSQLMGYFYKYLSDGNTTSSALRLAKLDYLKTAGPNKQHPFYWGSFVMIGDDSTIFKKKIAWYYIVASFVILLAMVRIFLLRRRKAI